jgi:flagella basal body P-ring formation protein FlgA
MRCSTLLLLVSLLVASTVRADGDRVEDMLRSTLQQKYPDVRRWEIRKFADGTRGDTGASANTDAAPDVLRVGARSAVRVGRRLQWFAVAGFQDVVSATRSIGAGEAIGGGDVRIEERDVIGAKCDPLTSLSALNGMRTRRALRVNEVICARAVEPRPTVARGETVVVRYVGARVVLLTKGVAEADGNVGDLLPVSAMNSKDSFAATVSATGEVIVHE